MLSRASNLADYSQFMLDHVRAADKVRKAIMATGINDIDALRGTLAFIAGVYVAGSFDNQQGAGRENFIEHCGFIYDLLHQAHSNVITEQQQTANERHISRRKPT